TTEWLAQAKFRMLDVDEIAKKVAAASYELMHAQKARPTDSKSTKGAERRLMILLRLCTQFKDDPDFSQSYDRELKALAQADGNSSVRLPTVARASRVRRHS